MKPSPTPSQAAALRAALDANDKLHAIKLYREYHAVGLAEAKEAVEALMTQVPSTSSPGISPGMLPQRIQWIHEALYRGEKIEAIKLYRDGTNLGLKETKEAVEKLEAELRQRTPEKFSKPPAKGCLAVMVALAAIVALAIAWPR